MTLTHPTLLVTFLAQRPMEILPCYPSLALSFEISLNLKVQSIVYNIDQSIEELEVDFRAMPSYISVCLFKGDLPEVKGPEPNILPTVTTQILESGPPPVLLTSQRMQTSHFLHLSLSYG